MYIFVLVLGELAFYTEFVRPGVSTCHFAWAFHSEAEEEMLNMIPAMQRGDPQWSELRAVGVGWWVRNINTLRRMVEKVRPHKHTCAYTTLFTQKMFLDQHIYRNQ